jgi:hypothetical protein
LWSLLGFAHNDRLSWDLDIDLIVASRRHYPESMAEGVEPGMTISIRSRRDVVVVDPDKFLAAARQALRDLDPDLTEAQATAAIGDVYDAVHALLDRDGELANDTRGAIEVGRGAPLPGVRVVDRPDGLSPAGWLQEIVLREPMPLQDYGCFLPEDPFALLAKLPFVDEHTALISAPAAAVWHALTEQIPRFVSSESFAGLLGAEPRRASGTPLSEGTTFPGFTATEVEPEQRLRLTGRHRFSRYALVLDLFPQPVGTILSASTYAEFPGLLGRVYRLLVIDSRAHRMLVQRLLRTVRKRAEAESVRSVTGHMRT